MVLAASSSMLKNALKDIAPMDLDEMEIIVPHTTKLELDFFVQYLYGNHLDRRLLYSSLFQLIDCDGKQYVESSIFNRKEGNDNLDADISYKKEADRADMLNDYDSVPVDDEELNLESLNIQDVQHIIESQPNRITYVEAHGKGRQTKLWKNYRQVLIDQRTSPFLSCKECEEIFLQSSTASSTVLKIHAKLHAECEKTNVKQSSQNQKETPSQYKGNIHN